MTHKTNAGTIGGSPGEFQLSNFPVKRSALITRFDEGLPSGIIIGQVTVVEATLEEAR